MSQNTAIADDTPQHPEIETLTDSDVDVDDTDLLPIPLTNAVSSQEQGKLSESGSPDNADEAKKTGIDRYLDIVNKVLIFSFNFF